MTSKRNFGLKTLALGLTLCLSLGGVVGLAEDTQSSVLDGVLESMSAAESMTIDAQFAIRQNGEDKITGDVLFQAGQETQYASATVTHLDGETRDMEMSVSDGTQVIRMGDEYYSVPVDEKDEDDAEENDAKEPAKETTAIEPNTTAAYMSTVMDQLFGSVTDSMTVSETGLALHLAGDEVPAIVNLAVSMMGHSMPGDIGADAVTSSTSRAILHGTKGATAEEPEEVTKERMSLGTNLYIDRIDLDVAVEGDTITGIQCSIVLMGKDADGEVLETELAAVVRILDVNATTPNTVDLTGVEMKPVERTTRRVTRHSR